MAKTRRILLVEDSAHVALTLATRRASRIVHEDAVRRDDVFSKAALFGRIIHIGQVSAFIYSRNSPQIIFLHPAHLVD
jgi:hypothetical protein